MASHLRKVLIALPLAVGLCGATATAASASAPTTRSGKKAQLVASNVATPTAFAFGDGQVFMSDGTPPQEAPVGGVYVLKHGGAVKLPGSPPFSFGVTWHRGTLYVSAVDRLEAWSGWTGTTFKQHKVIYRAPKNFPGFNGLAFGADGRLYIGVDVGQSNDHGPATAPYQYDVLSLTAKGKHVKVVARGIRQPWQFAFTKGSSTPYVTDLGQDSGAKRPPDFLLRLSQGQNYGFPKCNWVKPKRCSKYAKPLHFFPAHSDAMGLGIAGGRFYISEFGGRTPAQVVSLPLSGKGKARVELKGFAKGRSIVGLGVHRGWVYVGEIAASASQLGAVYRFQVPRSASRPGSSGHGFTG